MGRFIGKQGRNLLAKQEPEGRNLLAEKVDVVEPDLVIPPRRAGFKEFAMGGAPGFSVMPGAEDVLPMVGQTLGGKFGPLAAGGAAVGEMARQGIKTIRGDRSGVKEPMSLGLGSIGLPRAIPSVGRETVGTLTAEGLFRGAGKLVKPAANRMMLSVLKPARDVIKRNPNLGLDALELNISGGKMAMANKAENLIGYYDKQIQNMINGSKKRINADSILKLLDDAKRKAVAGLKPEDASAIETVKQNFIKRLPQKTVSQTSPGFVLGPASKQSTPKIDYTSGRVSPRALFASRTGEVPGLQSIELPRQRIVSATPKETYSIRPETRGPEITTSRRVYDRLGMNIGEGHAMKKAIYSETPDVAFNRAMQESPGATEGRRTIASALRRQIGQSTPEVMPLLDKEKTAILVRDALQNRIANEAKSVLIPKLAGMGAGGVALAGHPLAGLGVLAGDYASEFLRSAPMVTGVAKNMMRVSKAGRPITLASAEASRRLMDAFN